MEIPSAYDTPHDIAVWVDTHLLPTAQGGVPAPRPMAEEGCLLAPAIHEPGAVINAPGLPDYADTNRLARYDGRFPGRRVGPAAAAVDAAAGVNGGEAAGRADGIPLDGDEHMILPDPEA